MTMRYHFTPTKVALSKKAVLAKVWSHWYSYIVHQGWECGAAALENSWGVPQNVKHS